MSSVDDLKQGRDRSLSIEDIIDIVRRLPPEFAAGAGAGTEAHYGDTNYALLGAIIEAVTTTKVAGSFQEMVFTPWCGQHLRLRPQPGAATTSRRVLQGPCHRDPAGHVFDRARS